MNDQSTRNFDSAVQDLKTMRDEIRLKLHLAGKEARDQWETRLEPLIDKIENQVRSTTDNTVDAVKDAIERARSSFEDFRDRVIRRVTQDTNQDAEEQDHPT